MKKKLLVPILALVLVGGIGASPASAGSASQICDQFSTYVYGSSNTQSATTSKRFKECGDVKVRAHYSRGQAPGYVTDWKRGGVYSVTVSPGQVRAGNHDVTAAQAGYGGYFSS